MFRSWSYLVLVLGVFASAGLAPGSGLAQDADGDGVADAQDAAPCDASADGVAFAPAEGQSMMLAWEDLWPSVGDADFNDLVFAVNYAFKTRGGLVRSARLTLGVLAVGSDYDNGVALHLPISRGLVSSVRRKVDGGPATDLALEPDGEATFVISDNLREVFGGASGPINSTGPAVPAASIEVEVVFAQPVSLDISAAPFDLFLIRSFDRGHEIHGAGYAGSLAMNQSLFGTADDGSGPGRWFVDGRGVPFVLALPEVTAWPKEQVDVVTLFPDLLPFAASGGATNRDFYLTNVNPSAAYPTPPAPPAVRPAVDASCLVGQTPEAAGRSCHRIFTDLGGQVPDGAYWIDPDGTGFGNPPARVWCDMSGGGWSVIHYDEYTYARQARGAPSAQPGWSVDYSSASSPLRDARVESFRFEVEGGPAKTFDDIKRFEQTTRPTVYELFGGAHSQSWQCNSDAPGSDCHFTTSDGRHWGVWQNRSGCCIGQNIGGYWYYSRSAAGSENYGICGGGYPNGAGYTGSNTGCSGSGFYTPITPAGAKTFEIAVRLYVPPEPDGATCRTILDEGKSRGDGRYVIDPDGPYGAEPVEVWCDMSTDGGGWIVLHDDLYTHARAPRGTPSAGTGWSVDYLSSTSPLRGLEIEDFVFEVPGATAKTFRDVTAFGGTRRLTPPDLFGGTHQQSWGCDSDNPSASTCAFSTGDGRHWGLWEFVRSCCIGSGTGGFWFYSSSAAGTENFGLCGDGYPNGAAYSGSQSGCSGGGYYTPVTPTGAQRFVIKVREPARSPALNPKSAARASCKDILDRGESRGDGVYWIAGPGGPTRAACDMSTDGGGWTTFFAGRNGAPNVFDHFDANVYAGRCFDPERKCLRHIPSALTVGDTEIAVAHGGSVVAFDLTPTTEAYFESGAQGQWTPVAGRNVGSGPVNAGVSTFWTGQGANTGWIAAVAQSSSWVFAASYDYSGTWSSGNKAPDVDTPIRLMYREGGRPADVAKNAASTARVSCRDVLDRGESAGSGLYWLKTSAGATYLAYCDMVTDGGGWTAFVSGYNGSANTFDHMEAGYHIGVCDDPVRRCMRRVPTSVPQAGTELAVAVDSAVVALSMTPALYAWATQGTQAAWLHGLTSTALAGAVAVRPDSFWTGQGANTSWIVARGGAGGANTFAAQYDYNANWDYANGGTNSWSRVRLMYREGGIPQDPGAFASCAAARAAGHTSDGVYRIQRAGGRVQEAFCEMSTDGGGWQAIFSGTNGQASYFDAYDAAYHQGLCSDPATRCLRRLPGDVASGVEMAVACGSAMVAFTPSAGAQALFGQGTQANWQPISAVRDIGATPAVHLPNMVWTGSGSNRSFIFSRDQTAAHSFGSSYPVNSGWDYCNSAVDRSSTLRVYFREGP